MPLLLETNIHVHIPSHRLTEMHIIYTTCQGIVIQAHLDHIQHTSNKS